MAAQESRATRAREERARAEATRKEERLVLATKTAAINLSIMAASQIHDLHIRLRDEAWRGRVARVSASRSLLATENMLTAFPIQSLADAPAMVEFSRFPAALATAAEVYEHLEVAVRAAKAADRETIFVEYTKQMERIDDAAALGLKALRASLDMPEEVDVPPAQNGGATSLPPVEI